MRLLVATLNLLSLAALMFTVYVWLWSEHHVPWWNQPLALSAVFTSAWCVALLNFLNERKNQ